MPVRFDLDRSMVLVAGQTLALLLTCVGCSGGGSPLGESPVADAALDAARPAPDRGPVPDAMVEVGDLSIDAAEDDMQAAPLDAGPRDGAVTDAGPADMDRDMARPDMAPDAAPPDAALPDAALSDAGLSDAGLSDAGPGQVVIGGPGVLSGAGAVSTDRYRLRLSVDGPNPAAQTGTPRYNVRLGVGAPQLPSPDPPGRQP